LGVGGFICSLIKMAAFTAPHIDRLRASEDPLEARRDLEFFRRFHLKVPSLF
jgi:hypothetical protein